MNSHVRNSSPKWTPKSSECDYKGQNPLIRRIFYIIEKLLKQRYLKWARITHLDIWNMSYGQKKGQESNWLFNPLPLKVWNRPNFLMFKWRATYLWKALDEGYNFALDLVAIGALRKKLWAPKVANCKNLNCGNFGTPTWESQYKMPFGCGPVERCRAYYKREGGGFPQVWVVVSLVSAGLFVARPNTKSVQTMY